MITSVFSVFRIKACFLAILFLSCLSTTSCTSIGRMISTPNYSHHSVDKILLDIKDNKKPYSVYVKSPNNANINDDGACEADNGCFLTYQRMQIILSVLT